ncbi:MAG: TolC family protein [Bacteroidetes bacterium]|nr:MAG: TolC family protein [Bacteroidota bacterium]
MHKQLFAYFCMLLLLCGSLHTGRAQMRLSLEEAVRMGQQQSPSARIAGLQLHAARMDYIAFRARFKPQLSLNGGLPGLDRSITNYQLSDGSYTFITQRGFYSELELQLRQQIPLTGGFVFFSTGLANRINLGDNLPPSARGSFWSSTPLSIGFFQPLFQLNNLRWDRTEEAVRYEVSQIAYTEEMENVAVEITQTYFSALSAYLNMKQAEFNVATNDTIYEISQGRFSVGKIAENELLQSELNLMNARASYESAELAYQRALANLRTQLRLPEGTQIELVTPDTYPQFDVDAEFAVEQAMQYSRMKHENQLNRLQAERSVAQARRNNGFNANISARFGLNSTGKAFSESYSNLTDREFFTISLDMPIFQWGRGKAQLNAALARQKSNEERIEMVERNFRDDIIYQVGQVKQLRRRLDIATRSDFVAQKRYEISKNRYLVGKISIQDLFIAQSDKDAAQQAYVNTLSQYWVAMAQLKRMTLFDFETMKPILREEVEE